MNSDSSTTKTNTGFTFRTISSSYALFLYGNCLPGKRREMVRNVLVSEKTELESKDVSSSHLGSKS